MHPRASLRWLSVLLAFAGVLASSCSGSGGSGPDSLAYQFGRAFCSAIFECALTDPDLAEMRAQLGGQRACIEMYASGFSPEIEAALAAGTTSVDEAALQTCLDAIASTCDGVFASPWSLYADAACSGVFVGTVEAGGPCTVDAECAAGGTCSGAVGTTCGVCQAGIALGEICTDPYGGSGCATSPQGPVICSYDGAAAVSPTCHLVQRPVEVGPGENCDGDSMCRVGLYCGFATTALCTQPLVTGSACVPDLDACEAGSMCALDELGGYACRRISVVSIESGECDSFGDPITVCNASAGLVCSAGTCIRPGDGSAGANCSTDLPNGGCDTGLVCASSFSSNGVCIEPLPNGELCNSDHECASRNCVFDPIDYTSTCADLVTASTCVQPVTEVDCAAGAGAGAAETFTLTYLSTYYGSAGVDLDGVADACGVADFGSAIDDAFPTAILDAAADAVSAGNTFDSAISDAVFAGTLVVSFTVTGYGGGDDPCVLVDLDFGGGVPSVSQAQGFVADGVLHVPDLGPFRMSLPVISGLPIELDVYGGKLEYDFVTLYGSLGGVIARGGLDYAYASTTTAGTLHQLVHDVATLTGGVDPATLDASYDATLDAASDSNPPTGEACSGVSIGFEIDTF